MTATNLADGFFMEPLGRTRNYRIPAEQSTFSNRLALATLAAVTLAPNVTPLALELTARSSRDGYFFQRTPETFSAIVSDDAIQFSGEQDDFQDFSKIYGSLLSSQKSMPADFAEVISKNLWDLYES